MKIKFTVERFIRRYGEEIEADELPAGAADRYLKAGVAIPVKPKKKRATKKKAENMAE